MLNSAIPVTFTQWNGMSYGITGTVEANGSASKLQGTVEMNNIVMPVSMSVAKFVGDQREMDYSKISALKPSLPVWVVVHGMNSGEDTAVVNDVTKALTGYSGMQVVTINWKDAAAYGVFTQDAQWTAAIGKWAARELLQLGFDPAQINVAGWSHGSYVAYSLSEEVSIQTQGKGQINALVALDPAGNWPLLSGYDHTIIDFKKYSSNAVAIEGSAIAGSDALAGSADISFKLNQLNTLSSQILTEHGTPLTAFAAILEHERLTPGSFSNFLSLDNIMNPAKRSTKYKNNTYGAFEFTIDVSVGERADSQGKHPFALPQKMRYKTEDGTEKTMSMDVFA